MGRHMEAISGPGALQSKFGCSVSSEPLKNLTALTCEQRLGLDCCIDSLSAFAQYNNAVFPRLPLRNLNRGQ